ncbi:MAG: hypothetical protein JWN04_4177 [Myxococcaceae bacterium]|nr:hypothetical protein [Myxococcaceae bacterium]
MTHRFVATAAALMASVADSDDSAYLLSRDDELVEVNAGFLRFAQENGGAASLEAWRNQPVLSAIAEPLRAFFGAAFKRVRETGTPWEYQYECSSPARLRTFHMTVYPGGTDLVVVHSLRVDSPHTRLASAPDDGRYVQNGLIRMCSNCRRVQNRLGHKRWDWVPAYLQRAPVTVSHGLCDPCARFYWP